MDADRGYTSATAAASAAAAAIGRGAGRLLQGARFWSAIVMPFVAGSFLANVVGAVAGHCYGREC